MLKALINSMRLRTLPLSLAGVVCGALLAWPHVEARMPLWTLVTLFLTTVSLQVLTNLSNELGDHLSGVDGEGREGPNYSMADGGLTVGQMWCAINWTVVACCLFGWLMVIFSFGSLLHSWEPNVLILLGAASIWAATHYTLGKNPYGYRGLGDISVFIFFGLVSVMGGYFVLAHTLACNVLLPASGVGLLSVAVLNVNNIRDMASDKGIRKTIPLRVGSRVAKWYQTVLIVGGTLLILVQDFRWWLCIPASGIAVHLWMVWARNGKQLDPALPILVLSTFLLSLMYGL